MTLLAWLGLAGLSDAIVEWQAWFEQGVMQHWRSVKEWIIAVLLWWVPFRIPSWLIDYFVISAIVVRTSPMPRWNENWHYGTEDAIKEYGYVPFVWKVEWAFSQVTQRWPIAVLIFFLWPVLLLSLPVVIYEYITGKPIDNEIERDPREFQQFINSWAKRLAWTFISFVPVLFVCSQILYEHG